jgi:DNA-binding CsgD family transcriptional regulator/GAF domain-containing protein
LREAGIHVSPAPSQWTVKLEVMRTKRLFERNMARFYEMPPTEDPKALRMIELFASLVGPSFFRNRDVFAVLSAKMIRYLFRHGAPAGSPAVYVAFGMVLTTKFGDFAAGYRISKLAVELAERSGNAVLLAKTNVMYHAVVSQWMMSDEHAAGQLWDASRICVESGDFVFGSYALGGLINLSYGSVPLPEFDHVLRRSLQISELTKEELVYTNIMIYKQFCDQLQSPDCREFVLESANGDGEQLLQEVRRQESGAVTLYQIYTYKTQVYYLFGQTEEAIRCAGLADPYEVSAVQSPHKFILRLYEALALASAARTRALSTVERRRLRARLREFARFSRMSPDRFGHKLLLIQAEMQRSQRVQSKAMKLYDEAIDLARKRRDWQTWAVACECAAAFYERQDKRRIADVYLLEAYEAYERWGVEAKCDDLRRRFGSRLPSKMAGEAAVSDEGRDIGMHTSADSPDDAQWLMALKESLSFPEDLNFEQTKALLFNRIMQLSQAAYGCLFAGRDDGLRVERRWPGAAPSDSHPIGTADGNGAAPRSVVQYVFRVGQPVQAEDVLEDELFRYDPYFTGFTGSRTVCCLPVHLQDEPAGVLYLELPPSSYPLQEQRQDALTVLAAQMLFYARLSETLQEQTSEPVPEHAADRGDAVEAYDIGPIVPLSDREYEVLQLISQGMTNKEIAIQLGVTPGTVKVHTHNIFNKLNVNRRTQAIAQARKLNLLDL